ncbi:MAG: hypothetical protein ACOYEW_17450 [Anaerolineae bacterium]|jgi:hypothetical protein
MKARLFLLLVLMALLASACTAATPVGTPTAAAEPTPLSTPTAVGEDAPPATVLPTVISPLPTPEATATPPAGAVEALLDYFTAINDQDYARAFAIWAGDGEASGQTFDEFAAGFADTVQVTALLGAPAEPDASAETVTLPVRLLSVINVSESEQEVQRFQGTYTMAPVPEGWVIAEASVSETDQEDEAPADVAEPLVTLESYFQAINARDYARAFTYWGSLGQESGQTFAAFQEGFATTEEVAVDLGEPQLGGAAGSVFADVPAVIVATQTDGTVISYCGTYTLRRANVPPFDQFGWRIVSADVQEIGNVEPGSDEARSLLGACP